MSFDCQLFVSILFTHRSKRGACAVMNLYWEEDFRSNIAVRRGSQKRGASYETRLRANPGRHETRGYGWTSNTAPQPPGCSPAQWVTLKSKSPPADAETEDATVSVDCNVSVQQLGSRQASSKKYIEPFPASRDPRKSGLQELDECQAFGSE
jgi:hypothetical protein